MDWLAHCQNQTRIGAAGRKIESMGIEKVPFAKAVDPCGGIFDANFSVQSKTGDSKHRPGPDSLVVPSNSEAQAEKLSTLTSYNCRVLGATNIFPSGPFSLRMFALAANFAGVDRPIPTVCQRDLPPKRRRQRWNKNLQQNTKR